jgi:hypothetical protein
MQDIFNPKMPPDLAKRLQQEKENAFTLYWDFVIDGTASMASLYAGVYLAVLKFLEWIKRYEVTPMLGLTIIRSMEGQPAMAVEFEPGVYYTKDQTEFMKKIKYLSLYGGADDGKEEIEEGLALSLAKFPENSRNRGIMLFTDCFECDHKLTLAEKSVGTVTFFCPESLALHPFDFTFFTPEGEWDETGSPAFFDIKSIFHELNGEFLDDVVKPFKDLIKGVSIGV